MVFEVLFETEEQWQAFRDLPAVRAALDAVPDPVSGLLVYRGRGGGAGASKPRRPKPAPAASAVSLPEPKAEPLLDLTGISPPDPVHAETAGGTGHEPPAVRKTASCQLYRTNGCMNPYRAKALPVRTPTKRSVANEDDLAQLAVSGCPAG